MIDEKIAPNNGFVQQTQGIICSLASNENLTLFKMASAGVRYNFYLLEKSGISRKQYYRGLKMLRDAGLIRKFNNRYMHTTLGRLIYQEILKIEKFTDHQNEMKMIDVLKDSGQFSQNEMAAFLKKLSDSTQDSFLSDVATEI